MHERTAANYSGMDGHRLSEADERAHCEGRVATAERRFDPMWRAFPADLAYGSAVRQAIQSAAIDRMVPPDDTADLVLAVSEAFTNAVRHGTCRTGDCVWMAVDWKPSEATIQMRYLGDHFEVEEPALPPESSHRGRGRYIMNRLLDQVEYRFEEPWTELRMLRRFRPHAGGPGRD